MNGLCISERSKLYGPQSTQSDSLGMPIRDRFLSSPYSSCNSSESDALDRPPVLEPRVLMPTWLATAISFPNRLRPLLGSMMAIDAIW